MLPMDGSLEVANGWVRREMSESCPRMGSLVCLLVFLLISVMAAWWDSIIL